MDLATQPVTDKNRDAYYWRLLATAASFTLFGLGGLCLRLVVFPLLSCLPGDAQAHRQRARLEHAADLGQLLLPELREG